MERGFLVEQFGRVKAHQSAALNFHLNETVAAFDREYAKSLGPLGSPEHLKSRAEYAAWLARDLIDIYSKQPGVPKKITTTSNTAFQGGGFIELKSVSTFDPPSNPTKYQL